MIFFFCPLNSNWLGLKILSDHGLTFDWHTATCGSPSTIKYIPLIASKFPDLKIVIDHIAKPFMIDFKAWAAEMSEAGKYPNVYCKLSGLNDEEKFYDVDALRPYINHCLGKFSLKVYIITNKTSTFLTRCLWSQKMHVWQ